MSFSWMYSTELETVVRNKIIPGISDAISNVSTTMKLLMNEGHIDAIPRNTPTAKAGFFGGGEYIEKIVRIAELEAVFSHRDYKPVPINPNRTKTAIKQGFGTYGATISTTRKEAASARSPEAKIKLLKDKHNEGYAILKEVIAQGIFNYDAMMVAGSLHEDGMNGLGQLAGRRYGGVNYGGINRSWMNLESDATHTFWNSYLDSVVHPAADLLDPTDTTDYIVYVIQNLVNGCTVGPYRPTNIVMPLALFSVYKEVLRRKQMITDSQTGNLGFEYLKYEGIPVTWDSYCPDYHIYALNLKPALGGNAPLGIMGRKDFWFDMTPWKQGIDTLERVRQIMVDINMWCDNPRLIGAAIRVGE